MSTLWEVMGDRQPCGRSSGHRVHSYGVWNRHHVVQVHSSVVLLFVSITIRESRFLVGEKDDRLPVSFKHMHPAYALTSIASMQCFSHGCVFCC